jgi:hypothetical protein
MPVQSRPTLPTIVSDFPQVPVFTCRNKATDEGFVILYIMEDSKEMLPRASSPIIAQASAWIGVVMLLVQSLPAASCGCGGEATICQVASNECCTKSGVKLCCVAKAKSTCCSRKQTKSCCSGTPPKRSSVPDSKCCCGTACRCSADPTPKDTPVAPGPREDNRQERHEVMTLSSASTMAMVTAIHPSTRNAAIERLGYSTALDRCIKLSRFTC